MKGKYKEIGKSLAHIGGNAKSKGNGRRRNICQKGLSERLDINKICGGFINIRERIKITWFTRRH